MLYLLHTSTDPFYPSCWLEIQQGDFHWERPKLQVDTPSDKGDQDAVDAQQDEEEDTGQQTGTLRLTNINIQIFQVIFWGRIHTLVVILNYMKLIIYSDCGEVCV